MRLPAVQGRGWGEAGLSNSPTASSLSSLHRRGACRPLSEPDHVFLSGRPLRRFLGLQGCRHLCSSLSVALTSRSDRDRRPGRGCPSPTSTNAVFVLGPEPPVYMGHRRGKREQVLQCLVELLLQGPLPFVAGVLTFLEKLLATSCPDILLS